MQKIKYQMYRVASYFICVIEQNQIMLILSKFLTIFFNVIMTTELFKLRSKMTHYLNNLAFHYLSFT
jgi:hypothetical protein